MICDKGMFLLVMAFSFLAAQIVSKQVTILIIDVILKFDIVIIIVIIGIVINPVIIFIALTLTEDFSEIIVIITVVVL